MARELWHFAQVALVAVGGWVGWLLGGVDGFLYALLVFVIIDYLSGVMAAIVYRNLASQVGYKGIFKKVMIFFMVGIAHMVDSLVIGDGSAVRTAVIFFYIANEGISIIENAGHIGLPVPDKLKKVLAQLNGKGTDDDETEHQIHDTK
ncbi:phage holin family protein [Salisediminibacterium selenitireducens]|uniref:Toxin secretion/phage lysis holin n=1 Tax=Bacillus selenitireducens (strain ATCC 700615 / DSM 15326 / MLS10) TaxID=439292 RepID=D6XZX2_BACIE|nr:phage holin family protein [Salisediminibacterium selenitireducens]ADI00474.1 toxin secretion/phage lysis holin [[Bacillus] selenitireducens MLS10]